MCISATKVEEWRNRKDGVTQIGTLSAGAVGQVKVGKYKEHLANRGTIAKRTSRYTEDGLFFGISYHARHCE